MEKILAGDIGGTKTCLGIFEGAKDNLHLLFEKKYLSKKYDNLEDILVDFLRGRRGIK